MKPTSTRTLTASLVLAVAGTAFAQHKSHNHAAHAHGHGQAEISIQGNSLSGTLEIPMESLLGFEHAPRTAAQKKAAADLQKAVQNSAYFITPPAAAACTPQTFQADSPVFKGIKGEHSDLEVNFTLQCANPAALTQLTFAVFSNNRRLKTLKVELVSPRGQSTSTIKASQPVLRW